MRIYPLGHRRPAWPVDKLGDIPVENAYEPHAPRSALSAAQGRGVGRGVPPLTHRLSTDVIHSRVCELAALLVRTRSAVDSVSWSAVAAGARDAVIGHHLAWLDHEGWLIGWAVGATCAECRFDELGSLLLVLPAKLLLCRRAASCSCFGCVFGAVSSVGADVGTARDATDLLGHHRIADRMVCFDLSGRTNLNAIETIQRLTRKVGIICGVSFMASSWPCVRC